MVIKTDDILFFIPGVYEPRGRITITRNNGTVDDVTLRTRYSEFEKIATIGIGTCKIKIFNPQGYYSGLYTGGEVVRFYLDNGIDPPTTLRWIGRLDYPKDTKNEYRYIEIEGRHISNSITTVFVTAQYAGAQGNDVLDDLNTLYLQPLGITLSADTFPDDATVDVTWDEKSLLECLIDLAIQLGADFYIGDDQVLHFFVENSIRNDNDVAIEKFTLRNLQDFGTDTYTVRDKIKVIGEDDNSVPVLYTANPSGTSELVIRDKSITNTAEAAAIGEAEYSRRLQSNLPPQALVKSRILFGLQPGENFWISSEKQKVTGLFKALSFKHKFGAEVRGKYESEVVIEKEIEGVPQILRDRFKKEQALSKSNNPNRMKFSVNFTFDDTTNISTFTDTQLVSGTLQLIGSATTGSILTSNIELPGTATVGELRMVGQDLESTVVEVSLDDGLNWTTLIKDEVVTFGSTSETAKFRVTLNVDTENPLPIMDSFAMLFS